MDKNVLSPGSNIRIEREKSQITLRELEKKINISASFLSQVETGRASPSLATLKKIADALHTSIGTLVGENENSNTGNPILRKEERILIDKMGRGINIELLAARNINNQMQPYTIDFDKNGDSGAVSQHSGQEVGYVLKGSIELNYNKIKYVLNVGDTFYINANISHHLKNVFNGASQLLIVATPPLF